MLQWAPLSLCPTFIPVSFTPFPPPAPNTSWWDPNVYKLLYVTALHYINIIIFIFRLE